MSLGFISKKGMKSVNNLLDEYTDLTLAIIRVTIVRQLANCNICSLFKRTRQNRDRVWRNTDDA